MKPKVLVTRNIPRDGLMEHAPRLKVINNSGVGYDRVDVVYELI